MRPGGDDRCESGPPRDAARDEVMVIPADLSQRSVDFLSVSAGILSGLRLAGIQRLADLDGLRPRDLEPLIGLGACGAGEVSGAVARFDKVLAMCPVASLHEANAVHSVLHGRGLETIDDLIGLTAESISARTGIDRTRAQAIEAAVRRLSGIPSARLRRVGGEAADGSIRLPGLDSGVIAALALADTLEEEIYSLVIRPDPIDAFMLLRWWGLTQWPPPTVHQLATGRGLTAERVRQIIMPHEHRLRLGEVRPPIAARVAAVLRRQGPEMDALHFVEACTRHGLVVDVESLRVLPAFARIGLIGPGGIDFQNGYFLAERGRA